jgi:hypothetical protein
VEKAKGIIEDAGEFHEEKSNSSSNIKSNSIHEELSLIANQLLICFSKQCK